MSRTRRTELIIRAAFGVALALLIVIVFASFFSVAQLSRNSELVARSHRVISAIDEIVHRASEAESAQRGFVITGHESFVRTYEQNLGQIDELRARLRDSIQPAQHHQFGRLEQALAARLARSAEVIALSRRGGVTAVQQDIARHGIRGVQLQAVLRAAADEIKAAEQAVLDDRERMTARSSALSKAVIVGGGLFALIFVVLTLLAIRRNFAGRERAVAELDRFFDLSIDLVAIASGNGYFKRLSPAVTELLGYTEEEALAIPYMEMIHPDDRPRAVDAVKRQMQSGERIDNFVGRFRHKDGRYRVLSWRSMPRGDLMFATARDVTEEMRAQQELREAKSQLEARVLERTSALELANESLRLSERRFRALIENGSDSIALVDAHNRILYLSPAVTHVEGYRPDELLGRLGTEHTHPDDMPVLANAMQRLLANPGKPIPVTWRRRHKDGHWIWLEGVATNLLNDPSVGAIVCNYRDITERLAHERRLGEQLQRLALLSRVTRAIGERQDLRSIFQVVVRTLEDDLPVDFCLICLYDDAEHRLTLSCVGAKSEPPAREAGLVQDANVPIDENGLGRCIRGHLVYEPDIRSSGFDFPARLARAGMTSLVIAPLLVESQVFGVLVCARRDAQAFSSAECEFLRQASEHIALASHQAQLYTALQQAYDDLRHSQQQVMQQERLRALGQMASGIAHDINNAISPVSLYTEALLEREQLSPRARSHLEVIQRAVDDVAQTVQRMGEFYRQREPQLHLIPVELNKLVRQVIDLTRARWSDMAQQRGVNIEMRPELEPGLPQIAAVESQIRDALVNLVFNAVDAMPQGGLLTIRTHSGPGSGWTRLVHLEVIDQGVGMDEQTRRRCLEPFFTTKGERGTGLGLPMVYGVVQRHGASLDIESEPGKGTNVRLSFPAATGANMDSTTGEAHKIGPQRVLIIDDDPLLLKSLRDTLEAEGHEVVAANGGQAGINAFVESHAEGRPFPVVITDLGMPHVDGRKVASAIKGSVPETVILMLTGWGRRLVAEGDIPPGVDEVMSKPPKISELRAAFVAHLGRKAGRRA
jgi:PAS domain S-box-containing protein